MKKNLSIKDVNYVKVTFCDRWENKQTMKGAIKETSSDDIVICSKSEQRIFIKTPQEVELNFICDDGIYKTVTTLKETDFDETYMIFTLDIPKNIAYQQNREFFRVHIIEGSILSFKVGEETKRVTCKTYDISANGVCIELPERIKIPEEVSLNILFDQKEIKTDAKFVRLDISDEVVRASFRYVNPQPQDIDFISQYCIKKQLAAKREKNYDN